MLGCMKQTGLFIKIIGHIKHIAIRFSMFIMGLTQNNVCCFKRATPAFMRTGVNVVTGKCINDGNNNNNNNTTQHHYYCCLTLLNICEQLWKGEQL